MLSTYLVQCPDRGQLQGSIALAKYLPVSIIAQSTSYCLLLYMSTATVADDEFSTETVLSDVYRDPLDTCMEAIEDLATAILRTGKLTIPGDPGGMYFICMCI